MAPAPPSRSKSGCCRTRRSAASSPQSRRRSRSARSNLPTAAASKVFWPRPRRLRTPVIFQVLAVGARLLVRREFDHAHMRGDDTPAFRETYPGLHLAADLAGKRRAIVQRRSNGEVAAVGADDGLRQGTRQACRRPRGAERHDLCVAVKILPAAVADGARIVVKQRIEGDDVVRYQRFLVTIECGSNFGDDLRQVDLHGSSPYVIFAISQAAWPRRRPWFRVRAQAATRHPRAMAQR